MEFNSTHAGKMCRFHFALSNLADGSNGIGAELIYSLKSGVIDDNLTWDTRPTMGNIPIASFGMADAKIIPGNPEGHEMYPAQFRFDFHCPTVKTEWEIRGSSLLF